MEHLLTTGPVPTPDALSRALIADLEAAQSDRDDGSTLRFLALARALVAPEPVAIDPIRWLTPDRSPSVRMSALRSLADRPEPPIAGLVEEEWQRWRAVVAHTSAHSLWSPALCCCVALIRRTRGSAAARAAAAGLPEEALDALVAAPDAPIEARELWFERPPRPAAGAWRSALRAVLDDPRARALALSGAPAPGGPLDAALVSGLRSWPADRIVAWFEGAPDRWREALDRLLLPVPLLAAHLDPAASRERLHRAFAEARDREEAQREQFDALADRIAAGAVVQIRVCARVKGGWRVAFAPSGPDPVVGSAFLPGSQLHPPPPLPRPDPPEDIVGLDAMAQILKLNLRRRNVVVSCRALAASGRPARVDPRLAAVLRATDGPEPRAGGPIWSAPFERDRALALIGGWDALSDLRRALLDDDRAPTALWRAWADRDRPAAWAFVRSRPAARTDDALTAAAIRSLDDSNPEEILAVRPWLEHLIAHGTRDTLRASALRRLARALPADPGRTAWLRRTSEAPAANALADEALTTLVEDGDRAATGATHARWGTLSVAHQARIVAAQAAFDIGGAVARYEACVAAWRSERDDHRIRYASLVDDMAIALVASGDPGAVRVVLRSAFAHGPWALEGAIGAFRRAGAG